MNFRNGKDSTSKLLKSIQDGLNLKLLDHNDNGIGNRDLGYYKGLLVGVKEYLAGKADADLHRTTRQTTETKEK